MDEQLIEQYLNQSLTEQQRLEFEVRLEAEPNLLQALRVQTAIQEGVKDFGR